MKKIVAFWLSSFARFSNEDNAKEKIKPGQEINFISNFIELEDNRICAKAFDNRVGCSLLLEIANNLKDKIIDRISGKLTDKVSSIAGKVTDKATSVVGSIAGKVTDKATSVVGSKPLDVIGKVGDKLSVVNEKVGNVINTGLDSSVGEKVGGYIGSKVGETVGSKLGSTVSGYLPTNKIANTIGSKLGSVGSSVGKYAGKKLGTQTQSKLKQTIGKRVKVIKIPKLPDPSSINNKINNIIPKV